MLYKAQTMTALWLNYHTNNKLKCKPRLQAYCSVRYLGLQAPHEIRDRETTVSEESTDVTSGGSRTFSLGGKGFWSGGIQPEQLQVSYYELYYASLWF